MVEKNGMWWLCGNTEIPQVGEGHHPFKESITGVWDRVVEADVAEVRGRLEKGKQLGQKDLLRGNAAEAERCEVQQTPPR